MARVQVEGAPRGGEGTAAAAARVRIVLRGGESDIEREEALTAPFALAVAAAASTTSAPVLPFFSLPFSAPFVSIEVPGACARAERAILIPRPSSSSLLYPCQPIRLVEKHERSEG